MKKLVLSFLVLILMIAAVLCTTVAATVGYLLATNTLENDGRWISTKERLELFANGASSFMREPQGLARCRLNLGAWNGYQEILYKSKLKCERIEFDFMLDPHAYFVLFLYHDLRHFSGIRLSAHPDFPCAYLTGNADGEFTSKREIDMGSLTIQQWHHVAIDLSGPVLPEPGPDPRSLNGQVKLTLDGQAVNTGEIPAPELCRFGFRGCANNVYIDNMIINNYPFDDFFEIGNWRTVFGIAVLAAFFTNLCLIAALKMVDLRWNRVGLALLSFNWMAAFFGIALATFFYYYAERYPHGLALQRAEEEYLRNNAPVREGEIHQDAFRADAGRAASDKYLILVIGTSQTWGAGATRKEDTFVNQLQQKLDQWPGFSKTGASVLEKPSHSFVCVNAGIAGSGAQHLLEQYEADWIHLNPKMVIINLSCNDGSNPEFGPIMERFIALNKERGIQTVLGLEANSIETAANELPLHPVMRKVGQDQHVPVVEVHNYMKENHDKGFLWWDNVHATSFGQRLIAECYFEAITPLLPKTN